ncbi:MAG TPA: tetratricopeptide repeat protein [Candidatus Cloacimonadota bacterium]|nr:tetratricopeptide repeat protein [Candidatus Cloacimonadota bacterium]
MKNNDDNKVLLVKAESLCKAGDYQESINLAQKALSYAEETNSKIEKAEAYRILGSVYLDQAKYQESEEMLIKAIELYDESNVVELMHIYSNLGTLYIYLGNDTKALEYLYKGLDLAAENNNKELLARLYTSLGNYYLNNRNAEKSREYYKKAYSIYKSSENYYDIASVFNGMAIVKYLNYDNKMAIAYFKKAYKIWESHSYKKGMLNVLNNIARILMDNDDFVTAIEYIEKQISLAIELDNANIQFLAYTHLGKIYTTLKEYEKASDYFKDAEQLFTKIKEGDSYGWFLKAYMSFLKETGNYQKAYEKALELIEYSKKDYENQINEQMKKVQTSLVVKEKEEQNEEYRLKNEALAKALKEIEIQKEQLNEANKRLTELDEVNNAIVGAISHDLKNYIGAISSVGDLLKLEDLDSKQKQYVDAIKQSAQNALKLVKDLLEVNYIESNDFQISLLKTDINDIFLSFMYTLKIFAQNKNINIELNLPDETIYALVDIDRFWQAISNIAFNAIKFTPRDGNVCIKLSKVNNLARVDIIDNGIGISPDMIEFVFDKFSKVKRKGTEGEATFGLGLYIVKLLITKHQGSVSVESEPDKGSKFSVFIPCAE